MLKLFFLLALAALIQAIAASSVTILQPKSGNEWPLGEQVHITWTPTKAALSKKVNIAIASGPRMALVVKKVIARNVRASAGRYEWKIPADFPTSSKYVVEVGVSDSDIAFAGYISIVKERTKSTDSSSDKKSTHTTTKHKTTSKSHTKTTTRHHTTTTKHHSSSTAK